MMAGQFKVAGDFNIMLKWDALFGAGAALTGEQFSCLWPWVISYVALSRPGVRWPHQRRLSRCYGPVHSLVRQMVSSLGSQALKG